MKNYTRLAIFMALAATAVALPVPAAPAPDQQAYLNAPNTEAADSFGFGITISGDTPQHYRKPLTSTPL